MPEPVDNSSDESTDARGAEPSVVTFEGRLLEAFEALARGEFAVRLERTGVRDVEDTIAYLVNVLAEELGRLFRDLQTERRRLETSAIQLTEVLSALGMANFDRRAQRSYDGSAHDVLAFLVNSTAEELGTLYRDLEAKNAALEVQAQAAAGAQVASITTLAAGVGHELRNPLAAALGSVEYVRDALGQGPPDPDALVDLREALDDSSAALGRATKIASELSLLNPLKNMEEHRLAVSSVVDTALKLLRNVVVHRATLTIAHRPVGDVIGDEARLGQVVLNLVQNAVLAFPPDLSVDEARIEVSTYESPDRRATIEVADNGVGMSVDQQRRVFEAFYTTRPVGEGSGLGLSISKRLIEDHGGEITMHSREGEGSVFRVLLPTVDPVDVESVPAMSAADGLCANGSVPRSTGMNVLVIDDDRLVVSAIARLLRSVHEVTSVPTGREGLALAEQGGWDAVVSDLMLPDISGQAIFEHLAQIQSEMVHRFAFITGGTFTADAERFLASVDAPVLYKPFTRTELLDLLDGIAEQAPDR